VKINYKLICALTGKSKRKIYYYPGKDGSHHWTTDPAVARMYFSAASASIACNVVESDPAAMRGIERNSLLVESCSIEDDPDGWEMQKFVKRATFQGVTERDIMYARERMF